jgi:hypothetical protein
MIIVRLAVNNILLITWSITRVTRRMTHKDLEMLTRQEHLGPHPVTKDQTCELSNMNPTKYHMLSPSYYYKPGDK